MKNIIINADDYALTPGVSLGIRELLQQQSISGTSVMSLSQYWPKEAVPLRELATEADIGLHLTLTDLQPLTKMPKLAPDNKLPSLKKLIGMAYTRTLPVDEIAAELLRQFTVFVEHFGSMPSHLDGHHHIQILPGIREMIIKLYQRHLKNSGAHIRNCYLNPITAISQNNPIKNIILSCMSFKQKNLLVKHKIPTNNGFLGAYDFFAKDTYFPTIFSKCIKAADENAIIMCHPGYNDAELQQLDCVTWQREIELEFLKQFNAKAKSN